MAIRQLPSPRWTVPGNSGAVAAGYYVYTYQPGTSTPKATYTDYTGDTANPNPIELDARGEWEIWWDGQYKVLVYTGDKDVDGVLVWSQDNYGEGDEGVLDGNYNLARNGSFEIDLNGDGVPDNWTVTEYTDSGGVTLDSTEQYHGLYALKFLSTGSGGGFATGDYFEVQGGLTYAVNFAIYSSVADIHNVVDVIWYTAAKAVISTTSVYDDAATNPTSWTYKQLEATAPATARFARVRVTGAKDDDATSGTCWFDNVSVVDIDSLYGYRFPNVNADVTSSDEELNILDGVTATTAELNILDGVTATAAEINFLSGLTAVADYTSTSFSPGGDFTAGTIEVIKLGRAVTVFTSGLSHTSAATAAAGTDIPSGFRPAAIISNTYNVSAGGALNVQISSGGQVSVQYFDWAGAGSARTSTGGFSITYLTA